jgi:hypothetical protein
MNATTQSPTFISNTGITHLVPKMSTGFIKNKLTYIKKTGKLEQNKENLEKELTARGVQIEVPKEKTTRKKSTSTKSTKKVTTLFKTFKK